MENRWAE